MKISGTLLYSPEQVDVMYKNLRLSKDRVSTTRTNNEVPVVYSEPNSQTLKFYKAFDEVVNRVLLNDTRG